ncbi:membrane-associated protein, putative [Bodo saltans]|uniref:Membrane-associated protein, putative n=1 Tax=Bodo saltans TaxID=75058 RepID=A0A0S4ITI2_BODSA|nr:membrane-associated protein, putative [Bodo saltans]|eukprot:CUG06570.1 membrane-associated protein, putative [Bodo saltans]
MRYRALDFSGYQFHRRDPCPSRTPRRYLVASVICFPLFSILVVAVQAATLSITTPGTFNASCADVFISTIGSVVVIDPGSNVWLYTPSSALSVSCSTCGTTGYSCNCVTSCGSYAGRGVSIIGSQKCPTTVLTVSTDSYYTRCVPQSDQFQINFGASNRSVVFSTRAQSPPSPWGEENIMFSSTPFYPYGTVSVVFTTNSTNYSFISAILPFTYGVLNVSTTGPTYQAYFGSLSSVTCLLTGISTLSFTAAALTYATISLQGIATPAASPVATTLNVLCASSSFAMFGSTLSISRASFDPGNVNVFPGVSSITYYSSSYPYYYYAVSSLRLSCSDALNNRVVNVGAAPVGNIAGSSFASTTFSFLALSSNANGAVTLIASQFSLVATGAFGTRGTVRLSPSTLTNNSTTCSSSSSVVSTNVLFDGPFSSTQFTVSGNQVNVTLSNSTVLSSVGITVTQLGSNAISCIPSNFNLNTGATLYSSTFVMKPYALGVGLIQSGVVLVGSSIISIAPTSAVSTPARVTINTVYASTGVPTITFLPRGTSDVMYINPDRNETAFPPSLVPLGIVMRGVSCAGQQLVLGTDNSASSSTLLPARQQMLSIIAFNIGAGISIASGSTLVGINIAITVTCGSQPPQNNIAFLGTSLRFEIPASIAQMQPVATLWISGTFTSNTTLFVNVTRNATISFPTFVISDNTTVVIDLSTVSVINPGFLMTPFQPMTIVRGSRLEINAPFSQFDSNAMSWSRSQLLASTGKQRHHQSECNISVYKPVGNGSHLSRQQWLCQCHAFCYRCQQLLSRLHRSEISIAPQSQGGCNSLLISGSLLTRSAISVRVLGRTVNISDFDITARNNTAVVAAQDVNIFGSHIVDTSLDLTVNTAPTSVSFEPRTLLRSAIKLAVNVAVTTVTSNPVKYQYSNGTNAAWALLLGSVELLQRSAVGLTSQYQLSSGAILTPSQIPAADVLPTVLTVTGRNWESGASLSLTAH